MYDESLYTELEDEDEIEALRTKIERIERTALEEFNEQMDIVIERLGYGNIERVWLERTETDVRRGRRRERKSVFDLDTVRETTNGKIRARKKQDWSDR